MQGIRPRLKSLVAAGATGALAVSGLMLGAAAPANAVPVPVTAMVTDPAGIGVDGYADVFDAATGDYVSYGMIENGVFQASVEPGTYKFEFTGFGSVSEFYNDAATIEAATPVTVSGATALGAVTLADAPNITGSVVDDKGRPLSSVYVRAYRADDPAGNVKSANTRSDGTFELEGVAPGAYKLLFEPSNSQLSDEWFNDKYTHAAADVVTVADASVAVGAVALAPTPVVTGTITSDAGVPLAGVGVSATALAGSGGGYVYTNRAGQYVMRGLSAGEYRFAYSDPAGEYLPEFHPNVTDQTLATPVAVPPTGAVVDAALAPNPRSPYLSNAGVVLSGTVTDSSGAPVPLAQVDIMDATPGGRIEALGSVLTNRAGVYQYRSATTVPKTFKVKAAAGSYDAEGEYVPLPRYLGGTQSYASATAVSPGNLTANIVLPLSGGISGTVTSEAGFETGGVSVELIPVDAEGKLVNNGPEVITGAGTLRDGTFKNLALEPGRYKVYFLDSATPLQAHAPEWWDNTTFAKAKIVTVKSGATTGNVNAALARDIKPIVKPSISGSPYLGGKVTAKPGVWTVDMGTTFTYEWLLGSTVVGTGSSFSIPKSMKNKKVALRVTASYAELQGVAVVNSQVLKTKPKVKVKAAGSRATITISGKKVKPGTIKGKVVAKMIKDTDEYGQPKYKTVGKAKVKNGKAVVSMKKLAKGKNKVTFFITLKGKLGNAEVTKKIKTKK